MFFSTQRFVNSSPPLTPETLSAPETSIAPETHAKEQIRPADCEYPQFSNCGINAFYTSCKLDFQILKKFTEGILPADEKSLSTIAMYALQHEPDVFLWIIGHANSLSFTSHGMDDDQVAKLAKLLQGNKKLTSLTLSNSNISVESVKEIAQVLPSTALTSFNLVSSNLGNTGAAAIAAALPNTVLTSLNLGGSNNIGVTGARALATSLRGNKNLTSLILYGNNIGNAGAEAIAGELPNTILISLDLRWNNIREDGATAIAEALKHNGTLINLYLFDYNLPQWKNSEAVKTIKQEIERNQFLNSPERENTLQQLSPIFTGNTQVDNNMLPELPQEIALEIFKYMDHKDLAKMKTVHRLNPIDNGVTPAKPVNTNPTKT
jgi:hypothetical protein